MVGSVAVELQFVAGNPNLTFIFFIALSMLTMLGLRFGYYAYRNRVESDLIGEHRLWDYLALVGLLSFVYSLLGILEIVTTLSAPYSQALLLGIVLLLAVTMRLLYRSVVPTTTATDSRYERALTTGAVLVVVFVFVGLLVFGRHRVVVGMMGASAVLMAMAGFAYGRQGLAETRVQGTVIDTLTRHLLPVLLFSAFIPAVEIATLFGLDRAVVLHVQVVFVIVTASTLMTATIKLRQNLASL